MIFIFEVIRFITNLVIEFILELKKIYIPGTYINLLTLFVAITMLKMLMGFLFNFFRMEKTFKEKQFKVKLYNKGRDKYIARGSKKYLKNNRL